MASDKIMNKNALKFMENTYVVVSEGKTGHILSEPPKDCKQTELSLTNNDVHSFVETEGNNVPLKQDVLHIGKAPCRNYN